MTTNWIAFEFKNKVHHTIPDIPSYWIGLTLHVI
jgi:hypothetical protein